MHAGDGRGLGGMYNKLGVKVDSFSVVLSLCLLTIVVSYPAMLDTVLRHEEYDPIYGSRNYYDLFHLNC